jgi:RNA polymerase sigma-B factor
MLQQDPQGAVVRLQNLKEYYDLKAIEPIKARRLRDRIAQQNDPLALKIARRMQATCKEELEDLAQLARMGLFKAIERFDPSRGVAFSSFAVPYIRGEILHHLRDHWSLLKVPRRWLETFEQVERIQKRMAAKGRKVEAWQIAQSLNISADTWEQIESAFGSSLVPIEEIAHLGQEADEDDRADLQLAAIKQTAKLPYQMRQCITEYLLGRAKEAVISRELKLPPGQVKSLLSEGLRRLALGKLEEAEFAKL